MTISQSSRRRYTLITLVPMHFTLDTKKSGIVELDNENKVVAFLEKPDPTTTSSRWAVSNKFNANAWRKYLVHEAYHTVSTTHLQLKMNMFKDWLSETNVVSVCNSFFSVDCSKHD
jgi:hypothetical protein